MILVFLFCLGFGGGVRACLGGVRAVFGWVLGRLGLVLGWIGWVFGWFKCCDTPPLSHPERGENFPKTKIKVRRTSVSEPSAGLGFGKVAPLPRLYISAKGNPTCEKAKGKEVRK